MAPRVDWYTDRLLTPPGYVYFNAVLRRRHPQSLRQADGQRWSRHLRLFALHCNLNL